jgi:transposase
MLTLSPRVRVFVAAEPVDLHLSFDRLSGLVRNRLRGDPLSGDLFAFFNKGRTRTKILLFDGSGFAVYYKRLERGTFQLPAMAADATRAEVDAATLAMILEGIDLRAPRRLRYRLDASRDRVAES